jgi:biotin carboxyl carrier protein
MSETIHISLDGTPCRIRITQRENAAPLYEFAREGEDFEPVAANVAILAPRVLSLLLEDGTSWLAQLDSGPLGNTVVLQDNRYAFASHDPRSLSARRGAADAHSGPATLTSPMPGRVVRILQPAGSQVEAKQGILMVEAMKMQNELKSPRAGTVESILVTEGDNVTAGQPLAVIR